MKFSTYFSEQARRPFGLFGRAIMSTVFDRGNAFLNGFVSELMPVLPDDHIIEIGFGTGNLIKSMAKHIEDGHIEGIDLSGTMASIARKRNIEHIAKGKVKIMEGDFDKMPYEKETFTKACSVNTLYFWKNPEKTTAKLANILKPQGKLILAFEDINQLKKRKLDATIFHLYETMEVRNLLCSAGFSSEIDVQTKKRGRSLFHCVVATK